MLGAATDAVLNGVAKDTVFDLFSGILIERTDGVLSFEDSLNPRSAACDVSTVGSTINVAAVANPSVSLDRQCWLSHHVVRRIRLIPPRPCNSF